MRALSTKHVAWKNTLTGGRAYIALFEFHRDASNISRFAAAPKTITYDGNTYTAKQIGVSKIAEDSAGTLHNMKITVGDASQAEMAHCMLGRYRDFPMVIRVINLDDYSSGTDQVIFRSKIISAAGEEGAITFICGGYDLRRTTVPRETLQALICRFRAADRRCGDAGAAAGPCGGTLEECRDIYDNLTRIGAAPGMPRFSP